MARTIDIYQKVTDQIIRQIEAGAGAFNMPWHEETFIPSNVTRRSQYQGVNILHLWSQAKFKGYSIHLWGTRNQWNKLGAKVRRGEKPTEVVYCNFYEDVDEHHVRMWKVFNVAQVRGYSVPITPTPILQETERIENAEAFFRKIGANVRHGGNRAYYNTEADFIQMPDFERFIDGISYYSTLGHEHIHWTGAGDRLKRLKDTFFGSEEYAFEELIAEIGAAFLCARLRITNKPRKDHAQYIAHWLRRLRDDKTAIFKAASKGQKATDWLYKKQKSRKKVESTTMPRFSASQWFAEQERRRLG